MPKLRKLAIATLVSMGAIASAHAGLTGDTMQGYYYFPDTSTPYGSFAYSTNPFVVGPGVDTILTVDGRAISSVDFADASLVMTAMNGGGYSTSSFNGPMFQILTPAALFAPVSGVATSAGQTVSASVVGNQLWLNWQSQTFKEGDTITVTFEGYSVPEPATLSLAGAALAAIGVASRRRRKQA